MSMLLNGRPVDFEPGQTVLQVATQAGVHIPHLCSLDWSPSPAASCRLCMVEVEGQGRLQTSCTLAARDGLSVQTHTPRVVTFRRNIVELLLASHPDDCLSCRRNNDCELSALAAELGVRPRRYPGQRKNHRVDVSSPSIVRDPNKCVLCGRCVTVCDAVQGVGAIDFVGRGFNTRVEPGFYDGMNVSGCVYCGQCVRVCPTAALTEKSQVEQVAAALGDPDCFVVAQVAPAVPATLLEETAGGSVLEVIERLAAALKRIGFDRVFDTGFAADLTIMEEVSELVERVRSGGVLPMFTSCSPAWVRYVEQHQPSLIPNMSTCKSPQQMAAALFKELLPQRPEVQGRRVVSVSIMPCTAKKAEADDLGDVDFVLTTRELGTLLKRYGLRLDALNERTPLDAPFGEATGAGRIFAGSGGVMEAAIRTAHKMLTGAELEKGPKVEAARGLDGFKVFSVEVGGTQLNFGVVNGLGRLPLVLERMARGECDLHFIEVMSCPGGCVGGGGQPYGTDLAALQARLERLYQVDRRSARRASHENEEVEALYHDFLGAPLGHQSHRLLHRSYQDRSRRAPGAER